MRVILFLALLAPIMAFDVEINHSPALSQLQTKQARIMEDKIIAFLECVREILKTGDPEFGFPSFNPLVVPEVNIDLDSLNLQGISGHLNVKDLKVAGIPLWDLEKLKVSITIIPIGAKVIVKITWPTGEVSGSYDVNASIFDHTFVGAGAISGDLSKAHFELEAQVVLPPTIKSAKIKARLATSNLLIENLTIDGQDVSGPIQEFVSELPAFLVENAGVFDKFVKDVLIPALNKILEAIQNGGKATFLGYDIPIIGKCLVSKSL